MLYILSAVVGAALGFTICALFAINKGADEAPNPTTEEPLTECKNCLNCAHRACELTSSPCVDCIECTPDPPYDYVTFYTHWEATK